MTDEELVRNIVDDEDALKELMYRYRPIIYDIIHQSYNIGGDYLLDVDDLLQEGYLALYQAAKTYRQNENTRFITYAYTVIKRKIKKQTISINNIYLNEGKSIDNDANQNKMLYASGRMYDDPRKVLMYKETIKYLQGFKKCLTKEEKEILKLREDELSYSEIASRLNISNKRVDNSLQIIKRKFKKYEES